MDITDLAEYKNKYLSIYSVVQQYLSESPQDKQWKLNKPYIMVSMFIKLRPCTPRQEAVYHYDF